MKIIVPLSVVLSVLLSLSDAQNTCSPCKCSEKKANCSRNAVGRILTKIPNLGSGVEILILEGQPLESIHNYSFPIIPKITVINLQNCKLNFVHRYSFKFMRELKEINLSFNDLESLDKNIFAYNTEAVSIHLNNNKLHIIKDNTFAHQNMLTHLYLQNNLIPNLYKEAFTKYPALKLLNLTNNQLEFIDGSIIEDSGDLFEVYLDENIFKCDCKLKPFYLAMQKRKLTGINSKCFDPKPLRYEPLIDLSASDFTCPINISNYLNSNNNNSYIITHYDRITLSCLVEANSEPYILWRFNTTMIYADNTQKYQLNKTEINSTSFLYNLTINNLSSSDSGNYECSAKNTGFVNTTVFKLMVQPAVQPKILIPTEEYIVVDLHETNYTLPFKIFAIPKPVVTWIYRDKILSSESNNVNKSVTCNESYISDNTYWFNLTIKKVKLKYRTEFTCNASNFKGSVAKAITLIILYPRKVAFEVTSGYVQTKEGQNVTLTCGVKAVPKPDIVWRYGSHFKIDAGVSPDKYDVDVSRDASGTYWSKLTIFQIDLYEGGSYKCEANNSEEIEVQQFIVVVNKIPEQNCEETHWKTTLFIAIGCILLIILLIIIIIKCCVRYFVSKNWTQEFSYRGSMLG